MSRAPRLPDFVARSIVELVEQTRFRPERVESVSDAVGRPPGVNVVGAIVAALHDKFRRIFKVLQRHSLEAETGPIPLLAGLDFGGRLDRYAGLERQRRNGSKTELGSR